MVDNTTLVGISRLKDFELITGRIGSLIPSYSSTIPAGCLRISVPNTEASKTEWAELYSVIGGEDGETPDTFILPYKEKEGDLEYYLVGKILLSDIVATGNTISRSFTSSDLNNDGYFIFNHGIDHINPIIQVYDSNGGQVTVPEVVNSVGQSWIKIIGEMLPTITGTWKATAIG